MSDTAETLAPEQIVQSLGREAKEASYVLAQTSTEQINSPKCLRVR